MKLALMLTTAIIAAAGTASAQEGAAFGAKAGVTFNTVSLDDPEVDVSHRAGFTAGLFASVPANDRISFRPELLYTRKGALLRVDGMDVTLKVDFVELPLLVDVRLNRGPSRASLIAGLSVSSRMRARLESGSESIDAKDMVDRYDVGLVTGFAWTSNRFVLDGRYTWGLANVSTDDEESAKSRSFAVSAGWRFR